MHFSFAFFCVAALLALSFQLAFIPTIVDAKQGVNGGIPCAACTVITALIEQLSVVHNETIDTTVNKRLCPLLPAEFQSACKGIINVYGPTVINLLELRETPDVVCQAIGICTSESGQMCRLFPGPKVNHKRMRMRSSLSPFPSFIFRTDEEILDLISKLNAFPKLCDIPGVTILCNLLDNFANNHVPLDDIDGDLHSTTKTFRGTDWRGKDCDDLNALVRPGYNPAEGDFDVLFDSNCNGISGSDPVSGNAYEKELCADSKPIGTAVLGDSASAHFHIPSEYVTATEITNQTFHNLLFILENEFDWPMLSAATGFMNSTWNEEQGPVDSFYFRMRQRNHCNHRDYQSIAVNGARSGAMNSTIIESFKRDKLKDFPVAVTYALIGNDVCNPHPGTSHMTTPEEFKANVLGALEYLNNTLPLGSHVMFTGLADGRILFDTMHARIHPLGQLRNDLTYSTFYDYLNCLEISPCAGWLTSNETMRNLTSERASQLSNVLADIATNSSNYDFDMHYLGSIINEIVNEWKAEGNDVSLLIEPVDGFHPNQLGQALSANYTWNLLSQIAPEVLGTVNPNNDKIAQLFGDQGGY